MHIHEYERMWIIAFTGVLGVFFAALIAGSVVFGVRVPDAGEFINPTRLDETEFANPGVYDMGNNEFNVIMIARMWAFQPSEIVVPEGATVTFNVTSADITHGFIIERHNINFEVIPGHVAQAEITFNEPGEYRFICHEYCGQGHHIMHGGLTVTASDEVAQTND